MAETTASPALAARPERCSNCDAKLPDTPVSLCPYCAMPLLAETARPAGEESPNAARIARIREHEGFAEAMEWTPPESLDYLRGSQRIFVGQTLAGVSSFGIALAAVLSRGLPLAHPLAWLGAIGLIAGCVAVVRGRADKRRAMALPLLRRPGLILDRRSETRIGLWTGSTTYFFQIEFEDGVVGEFAYPGRGAQEDPYVNNLPGVAYTRGANLLHFRHIRV
jgi:hypothetical protein